MLSILYLHDIIKKNSLYLCIIDEKVKRKMLIDQSREELKRAQVINEKQSELQLNRQWSEAINDLSGDRRESLYYEMVLVESINGSILWERKSVKYEFLYGTLGGEMFIEFLFFIVKHLVIIYTGEGEDEAKKFVKRINEEYCDLKKIYKGSSRFLNDMETREDGWHRCLREKGDDNVSVESEKCRNKIEKVREEHIKNPEALLKSLFIHNDSGRKFAEQLMYQIQRIAQVIMSEKYSISWGRELEIDVCKNGYFKKLDGLINELEQGAKISLEWRERYTRELAKLWNLRKKI